MPEFTPIQTLGMICLGVFTFFILAVLILECIGRFHCLFRRKKDYIAPLTRNQFPLTSTLLCCKRVGVSSGMGCKCSDLICYCCWKQGQKDFQVIGLPNTRTINNANNSVGALNKVCAICLENLSETEVLLLLLDCGHIFHKTCIMEWLKQSYKCPLCNQQLNIDVIVETDNTENECEHIFGSVDSIDIIATEV